MLFKKEIPIPTEQPPACGYCAVGRPAAADPSMILCPHRGVCHPQDACRRFSYDPLLRVPKRQPKLPDFSAEDFSLDG